MRNRVSSVWASTSGALSPMWCVASAPASSSNSVPSSGGIMPGDQRRKVRNHRAGAGATSPAWRPRFARLPASSHGRRVGRCAARLASPAPRERCALRRDSSTGPAHFRLARNGGAAAEAASSLRPWSCSYWASGRLCTVSIPGGKHLSGQFGAPPAAARSRPLDGAPVLAAATAWLAAALAVRVPRRRLLAWLVVARQLLDGHGNAGATFQRPLHRFARHIDARHAGGAARRLHDLADAGHLLLGGDVVLILVRQAAHQPAANARDLGGIERQVLLFGHLDGNDVELGEPGAATQRLAAHADAPEELGVVARADLSQLDARVKLGGEVAHQRAKVHPLLRREVEGEAAAVVGVLRLHQLHGEAVAGHAVRAATQHILLFGLIRQHLAQVVLRGEALHRLEPLATDLGRLHLAGSDDDAPTLGALGALDDDPLARLEVMAGGSLIVNAGRPAGTEVHHRHTRPD